jgi:hypothetical protein
MRLKKTRENNRHSCNGHRGFLAGGGGEWLPDRPIRVSEKKFWAGGPTSAHVDGVLKLLGAYPGKPAQTGVAMVPPLGGPRDCVCSNVCPGCATCAAIAILDEKICRIYCTGCPATATRREVSAIGAENLAVDNKVGLDRRVNFDMHGASMGEVGSLLAETADAEIYVPAHRIDERRDLYLEDVSLDMVVRQLGLLALVRP